MVMMACCSISLSKSGGSYIFPYDLPYAMNMKSQGTSLAFPFQTGSTMGIY